MVTWCEQRKTWRGFRCLAVCVVGSMEIERVRVAMTFFCDDPENEQWVSNLKMEPHEAEGEHSVSFKLKKNDRSYMILRGSLL